MSGYFDKFMRGIRNGSTGAGLVIVGGIDQGLLDVHAACVRL